MTKIQSGIKITAPATISGIGCGTDIFAFALDNPADEIIVQKGLEAGISIKSISGDKGKLSTSILANPAGLAAHLVWEALIKEHAIDNKIGVELDIKKKVPSDKGLGDKESLVVAAAIAVNEFFGTLFSKRELLPIINKACTTLFSEFSLAALTTSLMGGCMMVADKDQNKAAIAAQVCKTIGIPIGAGQRKIGCRHSKIYCRRIRADHQ